MTKTKKWVTIAVRGDHSLALRAEKKLRKEGVPVRLLQDVQEPHEVAFHWAPKASLGGTAIQVDHRVVEEACDILRIPLPDDEASGSAEAEKQEGDDESNHQVRQAAYFAAVSLVSCIVWDWTWPIVIGASAWSLVKCAGVWGRDLGVFAKRERHAVVFVNLFALVLVMGAGWDRYVRHPRPLTDEEYKTMIRRSAPPPLPKPAPKRNIFD